MASVEIWNVLRDVVVLLTAALALGLIFERLRQSSIVGCLVAGILAGPSQLGLVHDRDTMQAMAEIGVALLLFTIGLETSWRQFRSLGKTATIGGALQVILTVGISAMVILALGQPVQAAVIYGAIIAMSSTATVVRSLQDRHELDSDHGRASLGVLLLQDAAVVPLVLIAEFLGDQAQVADAIMKFGFAGIRAAVLVFGLIAIGSFLMPRILTAAAVARNRDLSVILPLGSCMAATWAAHGLGLSPALGAFAAGVILADSPLATQMRADVAPFRIVFVSLFFAAMGMLADLRWLIDPQHAVLVAWLLAAVIVGKASLIWLVIRATGRSSTTGLATGLCLAQIGEFSFVMAAIGLRNGVLSEDGFQLVISTSLLSLILTPTLVGISRRLADRVTLPAEARTRSLPAEDRHIERVVIVVGYGPAGREIVGALKENHVAPIVIDTNPRTVQAARLDGCRAEVGDASRPEVLLHAGLLNAAGIAVTIPDHRSAVHIIRQCRIHADDIPVVVRSRYNVHAKELERAGGTVIVDEEDTVGRLMGWRIIRAVTDRLSSSPGGEVVVQEEAMP